MAADGRVGGGDPASRRRVPGTGGGNGNRPTHPPPWRVEGMPHGQNGDPNNQRQDHWRRFWRRLWWVLLLLLVANYVFASFALGPKSATTISYTFFHRQVEANNIKSITATGNTFDGTLRHAVSYSSGSGQPQSITAFKTQRPTFANDDLLTLLFKDNVQVTANPTTQSTPVWEEILVGFGPTILIFGLLFYAFRRSAGALGAGGLGGIGRSRARRFTPEGGPRTTFADVAGIDEVKGEVMEIVEFLRDPGRFRRLGATIPKGVLLSGAPGTGKTLLARAVAGEAGVPFFSISASEFIEMIVGVGASRVRDLFQQAKAVAPAIIFVDELDAIGRSRGAGGGLGGHDEREQTLNQILTEMDGFTGTEGVVVLAATNRPEILDPALLRPGRFDRRVQVSPPDAAGRRLILAVHTRSVPLGPDVDLGTVASATPGMVGADLRNLVNEAALLAARRGRDRVAMSDFTDALEKVVLGTARSVMMSPDERERTAYHESGHALLGMLTPGADPVRKISIIPRGHALGATFQSPEQDRYGYSASYLRGRIAGALGGRAAEELVYGDVTNGAESDLDQVTAIARQMVGRWGMSAAVGPITVLPRPGTESPFGLDGNGSSPATRELVDAEVRRIVDDCYGTAVQTLREHRDQLDRLARTLLEHETLDEEAAYRAAGIARRAAPGAIARGEVPAAGAAGDPVAVPDPAPAGEPPAGG